MGNKFDNKSPVIIFSVNTPYDSCEELAIVIKDLELLCGRLISVKQVYGMYANKIEPSYVVCADDPTVESAVVHLCKIWNQECYLYLDGSNHRKAYFKYATGSCVYQGLWKTVTVSESRRYTGFTHDPTTGLRYVIEYGE